MNYVHVYPVNDLIEHNTTFENEFDNCQCNPTIKGLIVGLHWQWTGEKFLKREISYEINRNRNRVPVDLSR